MKGINFDKLKDKYTSKYTSTDELIVDKEKFNNYYLVTWRSGNRTKIYFKEILALADVLKQLSSQYPGKLIPAKVIGEKLTEVYPEMEAKMLRPTQGYSKYYYVILHLEKFLNRICYFKYKGYVFLDKPFFDYYNSGNIPIRKEDKWMQTRN